MKRSVIILLHVGYWLLYLVLVFFVTFALFQNALNQDKTSIGKLMFSTPVSIFFFVPAITGFYAFYFFLFPRFLQRKRIIGLIAGILITSQLAGILGELSLFLRFGFGFIAADGFNNTEALIGQLIVMTLMAFIHGVIALVIRGFISWYGDIQVKAALSKKNYDMEVALVKAQLNPHFLFNTINNIDVLIKKDTDKASEYLNQLSDILRFTLYETKAGKIALSKELSYIRKFVDLQKIRSSNPTYVKLEMMGEPGQIQIEPMLFIPFIENAFKHAENKKNENAINIQIETSQTDIRFVCENQYAQQAQEKPEHGGLGNTLIQRRLELLYPGRHQLDITNSEGMYRVHLVITPET